jgi:hypothetical protein
MIPISILTPKITDSDGTLAKINGSGTNNRQKYVNSCLCNFCNNLDKEKNSIIDITRCETLYKYEDLENAVIQYEYVTTFIRMNPKSGQLDKTILSISKTNSIKVVTIGF